MFISCREANLTQEVFDMKEQVELRARRSVVAQEIKSMLDDAAKENKRWESAQQEQYDSKIAEIDDIDSRLVNIQNYLDRIGSTKHDKAANDDVFDKDAGHENKSMERSLYNRWLRGGDQALTAQEWQSIRNVMSTTTGSQGGFSVQSDVAKTLVDSLKAFGGMRAVSTVIQTEMGNPLSFPTSDGTAEVGEIIAENTTATAADPTFGTVALTAYKFSSKVVAVPFELLQDSQIDMEEFVDGRLVTRLGRITNQMFTTGTGTAQPNGVVTAATAGKVGTTGQTLTVIFDDLIDLIHAVDPAYRISKSVGFMMADSSFKVIRKLKDSQNRPVFIPGYDGLGGPIPDTLLGYPVTINQDVAVMAANAKSILYGDFSKYIIRDVMQATMFRFTDSAYVKLGQVGFLMWMRSGGNLTDTAAVKYYQNSAT
jgi:HK97 family phage major capsid protein